MGPFFFTNNMSTGDNNLATIEHKGVVLDAEPENTKRSGSLWKPGQSGNPGGRPKLDWSARIARLVLEKEPEKLQAALSRCMYEGLKRGDIKPWKEIAQRAYGKLPQPVEHAGSGGGPIEIVFGVDAPPWLRRGSEEKAND